MSFSSKHIKAARLWLDWDQKTLAEKSGVSLPTIQRMEGSEDQVRGHYENVQRVRNTLEQEGIEFVLGEAPGVLLHPKDAVFGFSADLGAPGGVRKDYGR